MIFHTTARLEGEPPRLWQQAMAQQMAALTDMSTCSGRQSLHTISALSNHLSQLNCGPAPKLQSHMRAPGSLPRPIQCGWCALTHFQPARTPPGLPESTRQHPDLPSAMDEEPPVFLAYQPYKGPASIPHAPGEFFGAFFLGINVGGSAATAAGQTAAAGRRHCARHPL